MPRPDPPPPAALVGRNALLSLLRRRLDETTAGRGQLLLLAGEAGIGKTRLLTATVAMAANDGYTVVRGTAFPGDAQASGSLLLDLAGQLMRADDRNSQSVGVVLAARLREPIDDAGDRHRRRRLLVQDLTDAVARLVTDRRLLLVLEDLHWSDELSLEVFGHLASGLARQHTLVVAAFRSDELYPGSAIREWRGRLLSQRLAEEVRLPRLSLAETGDLVAAVVGSPAPSDVVALLHERSDGIPLHLEELVAAAGALDASTSLATLLVPETLADAVLQRLSGVDPTARDVAGAAAVIGRSFDFDLLVLVTELSPDVVDESLRSLQALYVVQSSPDGTGFDFRHALIRDTLYADVPFHRRRLLHERMATASVSRGGSAAIAAIHFDAAGSSGPAFGYAMEAGHQAVAVSAHREALAMFRRAQRHPPADQTPEERAALLTALAGEAAAVDDNTAAADAYREVHEIWTQAGQKVAAAAIVPRWVAVLHLLGEPLDRRVSKLQAAMATLHEVEAAEARSVRAALTSALAAAYMLDRRLDAAIALGEQSTALSADSSDDPVALNTAATLGSVLAFAGQEAGWALLEDAVARSVAGRQEAEAARSYRMIGSSASVLVEYERATRWLTEGIEFSAGVELWNHHHYMAAHLAHVQWATGDWPAARVTAEHALADGRGGITTRITALYVLGYLQLGQPEAEPLLLEALALGRSMAELQRISPPLWGLAENALLTGDLSRAVELSEEGYELSAEVADAAYLFPFLLTGLRARLALDGQDAGAWLAQVEPQLSQRAIPGTLPALTHAQGLVQLSAGDPIAARVSLLDAEAQWRARSRFWEGRWAQLDLARCASALRRPGEASTLASTVLTSAQTIGAAAFVRAASAMLAPQDNANPAWHPLSAREHEVARLVGQGMTNREIAGVLFLSPKTVSAHVEHILAKLGASRRAEIAAWVARVHA